MPRPKISNLDSLRGNELQRASLMEYQIEQLKEEIEEYDIDFDRRDLRVYEDELEQLRDIIRGTLYIKQWSEREVTPLECIDLEDFIDTYKPHMTDAWAGIKEYEDGPEVQKARIGQSIWTCIETEEDTELFVNRYVSNELYYIVCKVDHKMGSNIEVIEFI